MAKTKKPTKTRDVIPRVPVQANTPPAQTHAVRETVESIVIAFVLAFLFRTFEAEAFVIPTGSMAPTLMGRHKDVDCPKCSYRYQVSASEENADNPQPSACIAGMCPICHYVLPMRPDLPQSVPESRIPDIDKQPSYNGDRILVNKYVYTFSEPQRWDVVVFKYPGKAKDNYIKRLVGLPNETIRIYEGDLFVGDQAASEDADFEIARKPESKVLALRQLVHDTEYDPADLHEAGWPLRWQTASESGDDGWKLKTELDALNVRQRFHVEPTDGQSWLRYRHIVPDYDVWQRVADSRARSSEGVQAQIPELERLAVPRLITDANPYNGREDVQHLYYPPRQVTTRDSLEIDLFRQGLHWVGDLMVEADVEVETAEGELLLNVVEAGRNFTCQIDLKNGEATLSAEGASNFKPQAKTPLAGAGKYRVGFANFDDQLLLWVDGELISFDGGTSYDVDEVFGTRENIRPQTSNEDAGDLAPVGLGARGAKLAVSRLKVWRDIYYIADDWQRNRSSTVTDFAHPLDQSLLALPSDPSLWQQFARRNSAEFRLQEDQFFVMGDNSAESSDARLWNRVAGDGGKPGGAYLERRLLIGKALCVYWPHSWSRIPGTPIPFPLFPNFADMRLVR